MSNIHIIIVAGGIGKRMLNSTPKQFTLINNVPIWMHTFSQLKHSCPNAEFTIVIPEAYIALWNGQKQEFIPNFSINLAISGPERYHSVKNGLAHVKKGQIVLIHDAVRPFVSDDVIQSGISIASRFGAAIPAVELTESIRIIDGAISKQVDRKKYKIIQTPQFFTAEVILDAYRQSYHVIFTDDASVAESAGYNIRLIDGNKENIKITEPIDLLLAEILLQK